MIIEEIPFFVEFVITGIVLGFGYGFTKLFLNHAKDKSKYLDNSASIVAHLESEITNLKSQGATPEQTKRMEGELNLAKKVQQYEPIIRIVGKPMLKKVMSIIDRV